MAPHSSTLAWKIPRTEEPGGLQSLAHMTERLNDDNKPGLQVGGVGGCRAHAARGMCVRECVPVYSCILKFHGVSAGLVVVMNPVSVNR